MERYWVWEYGLFEKNPKRVDSLNPETTLEVVKLADAQAAVEALQAQLTQRTAELAAAKKVKADYDRWLSGGVYYTNAEFEEQINDRVNIRNERAALQQRVAQLEGERDALKRDQVAAHACAKTFEQMSDESSLRRLLTTLQADHARVLELVQEANYELAALFPMPDNPTFEDAFVVCGNKNPADARCVLNAYEAIHQAASLPAQPVQGGAGTGLYDSPGHDIPGATCL